MFQISGLNVLVTGASRGLGLAVANGLATLGANVIGIGRSPRPSDLNKRIHYFQGDLAKNDDLNDFFIYTKNSFKQLNCIVNIAGVSISPSTDDQEEKRFIDTLNINLILPFKIIKKFVPILAQDGSGSIINFSSINASLGFPGNPGYVAAKSGLSGLTRALSVDLAQKRIRVNSISPGYFPTSMTVVSFNDPNMHSERARRTILKRWGMPEELVGPVAFLCSSASSYITGHDLPVDGGWLVQGLK
jgi:NAD(P)-dependent dehydrogenase (short-subunit alcohol dehydrogenase family)